MAALSCSAPVQSVRWPSLNQTAAFFLSAGIEGKRGRERGAGEGGKEGERGERGRERGVREGRRERVKEGEMGAREREGGEKG